MLSCKEVSLKVSESLDRKLSMRERFGMKMHLLLCKYCRRVVRQMELLRLVSRRWLSAEEKSDPERETLPEKAGERILERLQLAEQSCRDH